MKAKLLLLFLLISPLLASADVCDNLEIVFLNKGSHIWHVDKATYDKGQADSVLSKSTLHFREITHAYILGATRLGYPKASFTLSRADSPTHIIDLVIVRKPCDSLSGPVEVTVNSGDGDILQLIKDSGHNSYHGLYDVDYPGRVVIVLR